MNDIARQINIYRGVEVRTGHDVDEVTAGAIRDLHGSLNEELKRLRRAMMCMWIIANPRDFTPATVKACREEGDRLLTLNSQIEMLVEKGQKFKEDHGWQS